MAGDYANNRVVQGKRKPHPIQDAVTSVNVSPKICLLGFYCANPMQSPSLREDNVSYPLVDFRESTRARMEIGFVRNNVRSAN